MTHNYFFPVRSDLHRALSVEEKSSQAVELAFCYKRRELPYRVLYSLAIQEEVQPGCTRGSVARLYKRKCSQVVELPSWYKSRELLCSLAVQEEVQPDCSVELPFCNKREL